MHAPYRLLLVILVLAVLLGGSLLGGSAPARADFQAFEAGLNPDGVAYEINADSEGLLWISDYYGEIWSIDPLSAQYKIYSAGGSPADARRAGDFIYWVDSNKIVRSNLSGEYYTWMVGSAATLYSTAVDSLGRLWAIDFLDHYLYRLDPNPVGLDPAQNELCTYTIQDNLWGSGYLHSYSYGGKDYLIFGNDDLSRLYRYNITDDQLEWWQESTKIGSIYGLTVDAQHNIWFANYHTDKSLSELDPVSSKLKQYILPNTSPPAMIAVQDDLIWYSVIDLPRLGVLDPSTAAYTETNLSSNHGQGQPKISCTPVLPEGPYQMFVSPAQDLNLSGEKYTAFYEADGWYMYLMPQGAQPWGIAQVDGKVWMVDQGRQKLVQTWLQASLRACKKWDLDKDAGTSGDQYPVPGWRMDLYKNGSLDPVDSKLTGPDGCAQWDGLELPATYEVKEELRDWEYLASSGCGPTAITLPGTTTCKFVNWTEVHPVFLPLLRR